MTNATVVLKSGRDKPVRHRHPWVFSGGIDHVDGSTSAGDIVRVLSAKHEFLAYGYYNPRSQITVRLLSWNEADSVDEAWWQRTILASLKRRDHLATSHNTNTYRLVYAEADHLPGLIVDRYGDFVVAQFLTAGVENVRQMILDCLIAALHPKAILDRSDSEVRRVEGLTDSGGLAFGEADPPQVICSENGLRFSVDLQTGQKTGFYLDQRRNRLRVAQHAPGCSVLDCFCYSGGFTIPVLAAHPRSVTCVDSSEHALSMLKVNIELLQADYPECLDAVEIFEANVFEVLRKFRDQSRTFDMIILDPPKLAISHAQVPKALRAYKDLNLLAMKLLTQDGVLATFSCSGSVSRAAFQEAVAWAATDAERSVQVIEHLSQGEDHPILVSFPESEYLKGLICRVS